MLPGIADVAVIVRPVDEEASLLAYAVAANPAEPPDRGVLRGLLADVLPAYMIPATIRFLPVIPRLHNFKPDFVALERLAADSP
jgi:acyl-coenzyme A synthetase/AMP-(fatty) acid ligase